MCRRISCGGGIAQQQLGGAKKRLALVRKPAVRHAQARRRKLASRTVILMQGCLVGVKKSARSAR